MFVVFATLGPWGRLGFNIVCALVEEATGKCHGFESSDLAEILADTGAPSSRVILSLTPDQAMRERADASRQPFIVMLDEPSAVISEIMQNPDFNEQASIRFASKYYAVLHDAAMSPYSRVYFGHFDGAPLHALVADISAWYRISCTQEQIASVTQKIAGQVYGGLSATVGSVLGRSKSSAGPLTQGALGPYARLAQKQAADGFTWPARMFQKVEPVDEFADGPVELLGPARMLFHGPYVHLPPGEWVAEPVFSVRDNLKGNKLRVDGLSGEKIVGEQEWLLGEFGTFTCSLPFVVEVPQNAVQVRLFIQEGALDGVFELHSVAIRRSVKQ